jgi:hypothetical protein
MIVLRFISLTLIALGLMLLGADIVSTLEKKGGIVVRSLDRILGLFGADSKTWLTATFPDQVAQILITVLSWPGWVVLGVPGLVLAAFLPARRAKRSGPPPPSFPISR